MELRISKKAKDNLASLAEAQGVTLDAALERVLTAQPARTAKAKAKATRRGTVTLTTRRGRPPKAGA